MTDPVCAQGWVLKGHGISLFYHGKVMEKSWNLKAQKEHVPCINQNIICMFEQ